MMYDDNLHKAVLGKIKDSVHIKAMEELSELINCLCNEHETDPIHSHLAEEIGDVCICLKRLRLLVNNHKHLRVRKNVYFSNKECVYILTNMQKSISKGYLYKEHRDSFFYNMTDTYEVMYFLMNKYYIRDKVQDWILKKEARDRGLLETNRLRR